MADVEGSNPRAGSKDHSAGGNLGVAQRNSREDNPPREGDGGTNDGTHPRPSPISSLVACLSPPRSRRSRRLNPRRMIAEPLLHAVHGGSSFIRALFANQFHLQRSAEVMSQICITAATPATVDRPGPSDVSSCKPTSLPEQRASFQLCSP